MIGRILQIGDQIVPKCLQETSVTLGRDLSYCADNSLSRQDGKEAESNDGVRKKSGILEIRIILRYDLVELRYRLMKLGADAACEIIPERREFSQQERGRSLVMPST